MFQIAQLQPNPFLKHTPHGVVNWVEVRWVRWPESKLGKIGRLLIQDCYCVFGTKWWGTVLLKNRKLASRCFTNVREQHLSQNDVTIVRPIVLLVSRGSRTWLLLAPRLDSATETITYLLKFDMFFSSRVNRILKWIWLMLTKQQIFNAFVVQQCFSEPAHVIANMNSLS